MKPRNSKRSQLGDKLESQKRLRSPKRTRVKHRSADRTATTPESQTTVSAIPLPPYKCEGHRRFVKAVLAHPAIAEIPEVRLLVEGLSGGVNPADDLHAANLPLIEDLVPEVIKRLKQWMKEPDMQACRISIRVPEAWVMMTAAEFSVQSLQVHRRKIKDLAPNALWNLVVSVENVNGRVVLVYTLEGLAFVPSLHDLIDAAGSELNFRLSSGTSPGAFVVSKLQTALAIRQAIRGMFCIMVRHLPSKANATDRSQMAMRLLQVRSLIECKQLTSFDVGEGKEIMRSAISKVRRRLPDRKLAAQSAAPKMRRARDIAMLQRLTGFSEAEIPYLKR